jgi:hypothetical protein
VLIKIIKASFTNANNFGHLGVLCSDLNRCQVPFFTGIMGVNTHRTGHITVGICHLIDTLELCHMGANRHHIPDPSSHSAGNNIVAIFVEFREIQVAMAINKHEQKIIRFYG